MTKGFSTGFLGIGRTPNIRPKKKNWIKRIFVWIAKGSEGQELGCGQCGNCKTEVHYNRWRRK